MSGDTAETWQPYRYTPSTILAAVFLSLFGITTLIHLFQLFRTRTWYLIPLVVGGVCEYSEGLIPLPKCQSNSQ